MFTKHLASSLCTGTLIAPQLITNQRLANLKRLSGFILLLGLGLGSTHVHAESHANSSTTWLSDWESIGEKSNIQGECRQHKSKINQCRMTTEVNASLSELVALLLDGDAVASWAPNTLSSETLPEHSSDSVVTVYMTYHFPGAINRDTVTQSSVEQDPKSKQVKVKFRSLNITGPKKDLRLVRFPLMAGSWTLTPISENKTKLEHLNLSLPGGLVQKNLHYLYNLGVEDASFDTILALKEAVKRPEYQNAQLSFIENHRHK